LPVENQENIKPAPWYKAPEYILVLLIGLLYIVLIGKYRAFDLDSVWFLSFSHDFWLHHIVTDTLMHASFPQGMGGVVAFGKLAAIVQGIVLSIFGWSVPASIALNASFGFASLILIVNMSRRLGYSSHFTVCYVALLGLGEPFVLSGERARYEFLPLFFLCLALWLLARKNIVLAMFVAALAAEVEPAAVVIPFAVFVAILAQNRPTRSYKNLLPRIALGTAAALAVYFLLHPDIVSVIHSANWGVMNAGSFPGGFIGAYYIQTKRHWLDLAILLAAIALSLRPAKRHLFTQWPALCFFTTCIISALLRWGNGSYFVFVTPFLCLFLIQAFYAERYWKWIVAAILLMTLPQYAYRFYFWSAHPDFSQNDQHRVAEAIVHASAQIGKSPSDVMILGNFNLWYAHPDHFSNLDTRNFYRTTLHNADLLLCFDQHLDPILPQNKTPEISCSGVANVSKPLDTLTVNGHTLQIRVPDSTITSIP